MYYIASDIHSFYRPFRAALDRAGFSLSDDSDVLVLLGDLFDRGPDTLAEYGFLASLPESRLILVRGNHEDLFEELLGKDYPDDCDYHNGTVKTFCQIAGKDQRSVSSQFAYYDELLELKEKGFDLRGFFGFRSSDVNEKAYAAAKLRWAEIRRRVRESAIGRLILDRQKWLDYFELGPYIMTHAFIPVCSAYDPSWRTSASPEAWSAARWQCPYDLYDEGLFEEEAKAGKTLVCGHWPADEFRRHYDGRKRANYSIYEGDHLIAIDGCAALSGRVNILRISDSGEVL